MSEPRLPNARRPAIPRYVRDAVFERDGASCVYCGAPPPLELDHVWPFVQGGSSIPLNLVVACRVCNLLAGPRVFRDFAHKQEWVRSARHALGTDTLARIDAALIAGDHAGAVREMEEHHG